MSFTPCGTLTRTVYNAFSEGSPTTTARRAGGGNAGNGFHSISSGRIAPKAASVRGCATTSFISNLRFASHFVAPPPRPRTLRSHTMERRRDCRYAMARLRAVLVRCTDVRKTGKQVAVWPHVVSRDLAVREHRNEQVHDIVGECPPIARVQRGPRRLIRQDVWQQRRRDSRCFFRRVPSRMFQGVRERGDETRISRRLSTEIRRLLRTRQENGLRRPSTPVGLNPFALLTVQRTRPQSNRSVAQGRIGDFQNDAADVCVRKEIVSGELKVVQRALCVEKEWLAAPPCEKAVVTRLCHVCVESGRDRCPLEKDLSAVTRVRRLLAFNTTYRRRLTILGGRELHSVRDIGNGVTICIDLQLV